MVVGGLQLLPSSSNTESHARDGSWAYGSSLEFRGIGGIIGGERGCGMIGMRELMIGGIAGLVFALVFLVAGKNLAFR